MEKKNGKKNIIFSELNQKVVSNIFFRFNPNNKLYNKKINNKYKQSTSQKNLILKNINNNMINTARNKIMKDSSYVYSQSNKINNIKVKRVDIKALINSDSLDLNHLEKPISKSEKIKKGKIFQKEIIQKKENIKTTNQSNIDNTYDNDDYYSFPLYNHSQVVYLKGKKKKSCLFKICKNNNIIDNDTSKVLSILDLSETIPMLYNNQDDEKLSNFALMERATNLIKPVFKTKLH